MLSQLCVDVRRAVKDVGGPPRLPGPSTSPFSAQALSKGPGCTLLSATFLPFLLVISLFKMAPHIVLTCCLVFPSARRLWCAPLRTHMCLMSLLQAWVQCQWGVLKQAYVLILWGSGIRGSQEPSPVFPLGTLVQCSAIAGLAETF